MIVVDNIKKEYRQNRKSIIVLDGFTHTFKDNCFYVIHGPSGCGKSSLLNILAGLERVAQGKVIIGGEDITRFSHRQLSHLRLNKIGFVFQDNNLLPALTAWENIMVPLLAMNIDYRQAKERSLAMMERFNIADYKNTLPKYLSGGEQQRVGIARALVKSPEVILADEPTASLDAKNTQSVVDSLMEIVNMKKTTLIVASHEQVLIDLAERKVKIEKS